MGMLGYGWGGWGMGLLMLVFWVFSIVGIILLIRYLWPPVARVREASPVDILNKRYACGEIDQEEFRRRKDDLEK